MTQDRGSSNPLKGLLDRVKETLGQSDRSTPKRGSGGMRTEAEQRDADAEFERKKAEMEERREAAGEYREKLELRAATNLRAERASAAAAEN
jgi:hypothetical protein